MGDLDLPLPAALPELLREAFDRLTAAEAQLDLEIEAQEAQSQQARETLAQRARRGDLGSEWQRVQQRIELGQTTLAAVFSGEDQTAAARALRERSQVNLTSLAEQRRQQDEASEGQESPLAALAARASAEASARYAAAARYVTDALGDLGRRRLR